MLSGRTIYVIALLHLRVPPEVENATQEYRREMDLLSGFINDHCLTGDASFTAIGTQLHKAYLQYIDNDKEAHLTQRQFYRRLREHGFTSYIGHNRATIWRGIALKNDTSQGEVGEE
jgi:putative DNA primase/helicase